MKSISKDVNEHWQATPNDIKEMQKFLDSNETPLRASQAYFQEKLGAFSPI